jgi:hypothetical protein
MASISKIHLISRLQPLAAPASSANLPHGVHLAVSNPTVLDFWLNLMQLQVLDIVNHAS